MTFFNSSSGNVKYLKKDCHVQQNKIFNFHEVQISAIQYYILWLFLFLQWYMVNCKF